MKVSRESDPSQLQYGPEEYSPIFAYSRPRNLVFRNAELIWLRGQSGERWRSASGRGPVARQKPVRPQGKLLSPLDLVL
jgi:hypothetical protein